MLKTGMIALVVLAFTAPHAMAQAQARSGTDKERQACTRDVSRHCRQVMSDGDFVVLRCLQDNRQKLSQACRKVLEDHGR